MTKHHYRFAPIWLLICVPSAGHAANPTREVPCTQGWDKYQLVSCDCKSAAGTADLWLAFQGEGDLMRSDGFAFQTFSAKGPIRSRGILCRRNL